MDKNAYQMGLIAAGSLITLMIFGVALKSGSPWLLLDAFAAAVFAWLANAAGSEEHEEGYRGFGYLAMAAVVLGIVLALMTVV